MEIRCSRTPWGDGVEFVVMSKTGGGVAAARSIALEVVEDGAIIRPTGTLTATAAQLLMDELWHCGLRPSEGSGSAGSLAATERHLQDMQSIAKGLLRKGGVSL